MMPATESDKEQTTQRSHIAKPGVLQGEVSLTVQTEWAQRYIYGRSPSEDGPGIWGLITFAEKVKTLWYASSQDDPYADWWLVKIDRALQIGWSRINRLQGALTTLLDEQCALQVSVGQSVKPQRIALSFSNPYAFRAAQLLAEYDRFACTVLTIRYVGIALKPSLEKRITACGRKMRSVFAAPQGYRPLGVNRAIVREGGRKAQKAIALMGDVPVDILQGEVAPSLCPKKVVKPETKASQPRREPTPSPLDTDDVQTKPCTLANKENRDESCGD